MRDLLKSFTEFYVVKHNIEQLNNLFMLLKQGNYQ